MGDSAGYRDHFIGEGSDPEERDDLWDDPRACEVRGWLMAELADEEIVTETWLPRRYTAS